MRAKLFGLLLLMFSLGWRRYAILAIVAGYLVFVTFLPPAHTVALVHAKSEQITFNVAVPDMARFRLAGFGVRGEVAALTPPSAANARASAAATTTQRASGPRRLTCLGGFLQPTADTKVTIRRFADGPLRIVLERLDDLPVAEFRAQEQAVPQTIQRANWLMVEPSEDCPGNPTRRFNISGYAEIGDELRPETSLEEPSSAPMLEGKVEIYGKTTNLYVFSRLFPNKPQDVYPVVEISLPPGSRISEAREEGSKVPPQLWSGFVSFDPDESALQIEVATEAKALALVRPGIGLEPEVLKIGMFAQLTNDPNLLAVQATLAIIIGLIQLLGGWTREKDDEPIDRD